MFEKKKSILIVILCIILITFVSCGKDSSLIKVNEEISVAEVSVLSSEETPFVTPEGLSPITQDSFVGTWKRTNVESSMPSTINIDNVTKDGFDFTVESLFWSHNGFFSGKAKFITDNKAVCVELENEETINIEFLLKDNVLTIPQFDNEASLPLGADVTICGDYVRENPQYTNRNNYFLIVPNEEIERIISSLMDKDTYSYFNNAANDGYITQTKIEKYLLYHIETLTIGGFTVDIILTDNNIVYIWCGFNESEFYTNDKNYINNDIYIKAKQVISSEAIPLTYDEYMKNLKYLDESEAKILGAITTLDMIQTRESALLQWDFELNKIYGILKEKLSISEFNDLREVQRQWIKDRDNVAENALSSGGSLAKVDYVDIKLSHTKERTIQLIRMYFKYSIIENNDGKELFSDVINGYKKLEQSGFESFDKDILGDSIFERDDYHNGGNYFIGYDTKPNLVYAFYDLNDDGTLELLIGADISSDEEKNIFVTGIYGLQNGKPVSLIQVGTWSHFRFLSDMNNECVIEHILGTHLEYATQIFYKIDKSGRLVTLDEIILSGNSDDFSTFTYDYIKNVNGKEVNISEQEYLELVQNHGSQKLFETENESDLSTNVIIMNTWKPLSSYEIPSR